MPRCISSSSCPCKSTHRSSIVPNSSIIESTTIIVYTIGIGYTRTNELTNILEFV